MDQDQQPMKFSSAKKYFGIGLTAFFVIAASIIFFFLMFRLGEIAAFFRTVLGLLQPVLFGLVIAYLLDPIAVFLERHLFVLFSKKGKKPRSLSRNISILLSLGLLLILLYFLGNMVIPRLIISIRNLLADLPQQLTVFGNRAAELLGNHNLEVITSEIVSKGTEFLKNWVNTHLISSVNTWLSYFATGVMGVVSAVVTFVVGLAICFYVLSSKETFIGQAKKLLYSVFSSRAANLVASTVRKSDEIFGRFIKGSLLDSFIIGVICFIVTSVLQMPYAMLVSVMIGLTNVIPFFGPYIGGIPSALLILIADPLKGVYFIIFIIVLQQIDGNFIAPRIVGNSIGLSPFWVVFSILTFGGLFGFLGMLFGVPTFAVIYYIIKTLAEHVLKRRGLPTESEHYTQLERIEPDGTLRCFSKEVPQQNPPETKGKTNGKDDAGQ